MKASEVHAMEDTDLVEQLRSAREEEFNLRLKHATGELEATDRLGIARRDVARLLTISRERGIDLAKELG